MAEPEKKKVDPMILLARTSFGGRRRNSLVTILLALAALLVLLSVVVWLSSTQSSFPKFILAAFDQVALAGEEVVLAARLEPVGEGDGERDLSGCPLFFQELRSGELLGKVNTSAGGRAAIKGHFTEQPAPAEIMVRYYPGDDGQRRGAQSKARVFVWPKESSLLVVDAPQALTAIEGNRFDTTHNPDIRPRSGAPAALRALAAKYRIIYLASDAARPLSYNKLSAWLERAAVLEDQFPAGPVVAPSSGDREPEPGVFIHDTALDLRQRFKGNMLAITGSAENAKRFRDAGLKTFLLGEAEETPEDIRRAKTWKELQTSL